MGFINLKEDEAKASHGIFYNETFEVMPVERCNFWDIFPINLILALADGLPGTGNWGGIISTDGKKVVITQSKWSNLAKHKKIFEFNIEDIVSIEHKGNKVNLMLNKTIKGLTMAKVNYFIKLPLFIFTIGIAGLFTPLFRGKFLVLDLDDQFKNLEAFKVHLSKWLIGFLKSIYSNNSANLTKSFKHRRNSEE